MNAKPVIECQVKDIKMTDLDETCKIGLLLVKKL